VFCAASGKLVGKAFISGENKGLEVASVMAEGNLVAGFPFVRQALLKSAADAAKRKRRPRRAVDPQAAVKQDAEEARLLLKQLVTRRFQQEKEKRIKHKQTDYSTLFTVIINVQAFLHEQELDLKDFLETLDYADGSPSGHLMMQDIVFGLAGLGFKLSSKEMNTLLCNLDVRSKDCGVSILGFVKLIGDVSCQALSEGWSIHKPSHDEVGSSNVVSEPLSGTWASRVSAKLRECSFSIIDFFKSCDEDQDGIINTCDCCKCLYVTLGLSVEDIEKIVLAADEHSPHHRKSMGPFLS
jgi:hypothetical protein